MDDENYIDSKNIKIQELNISTYVNSLSVNLDNILSKDDLKVLLEGARVVSTLQNDNQVLTVNPNSDSWMAPADITIPNIQWASSEDTIEDSVLNRPYYDNLCNSLKSKIFEVWLPVTNYKFCSNLASAIADILMYHDPTCCMTIVCTDTEQNNLRTFGPLDLILTWEFNDRLDIFCSCTDWKFVYPDTCLSVNKFVKEVLKFTSEDEWTSDSLKYELKIRIYSDLAGAFRTAHRDDLSEIEEETITKILDHYAHEWNLFDEE